MAHIRRLRNGRYSAQIYLGVDPATNKTRWQSKTFDGRKGPDGAEAWARKIEGEKDDGRRGPTLSKATLAEYLRDRWLPSYRDDVKSTYNTEKTLGRWIFNPPSDMPLLGSKKLSALRVSDFDNFYRALKERRPKPMQVRGIEHLHSLLRRALKFAVVKEELAKNPTDGATIPGKRRKERTGEEDQALSLTPEQEARLRAMALKDRWAALWYLLLNTGVRPGEAFALTWDEVALDAKLVMVRHTLTRVGVDKSKHGWERTTPKTKRSKRDVPISATTAKLLTEWREKQKEQKRAAGEFWQEHGFVFTTHDGTPVGNNIGRAWTRLLREVDGGAGDLGSWGPEREKPRSGPTPERSFTPRFRLYVLRHTCATLALLSGVPLLEVSRLLGHTDLAFTARVYGHVKAEHATAVSEAFERREAGGLKLVA